MIKVKSKDVFLLNILAYIVVGIIAAVAVIPFVMLISSSIQSEDTVLKYGYSLLPRNFNLFAYSFVFQYPENILRSYAVTIFITLVGTATSLFFSSMTAYVLSRKDLKYRNGMAFYLFFTTLFNGGLVPYFILISNTLRLQNSFIILLLSGMFNVVYIFILRTYVTNSVPDSISESAKIDGASDFTVFVKVVLPLLKPALAAIGIFTALGYWNDWFTSVLFISEKKMFPLQYLLYKMLVSARIAQEMASKNAAMSQQAVPQETLKLAMTVIATGPIILVYPFVQKYFVAGMTIGSVKG